MSASVPIDLARIVHDLRGPLMPLRTAAWLLRNELDESTRVHELVDIVDRQCGRLTRMMDELGDWARVASGEMALDLVPVEAELLVDTALGGIPDCPVTPEYHDAAAAVQLLADPHRIDQLLRTMIQNALHRDQGRVPRLQLSIRAGQLTIDVRDQGASLDAVAREALLSCPQHNPFDDGLGLRLMMAKRIAEAHGGRLTIDETPMHGLGLVCTLPARS